MVNEMREKVKRFEEAADSAEERVQLARREANVRSNAFALCVYSLLLCSEFERLDGKSLFVA